MCAQLVVYPQRRLIFSTTVLGWLFVPYYTQHSPYGAPRIHAHITLPHTPPLGITLI